MRPRCLVSMLSALALSAAAASACGRPPDPQGAAVRASGTGGAVASSTAASAPPPKITYGGSADVYYTANLNRPFNARNALRDPEVIHEHGPQLGSLNLWAEGPRTPVGFR